MAGFSLRQRFCTHEWIELDPVACRRCTIPLDVYRAYQASLRVRALRWSALAIAALLSLMARQLHIEPWHDIAVCIAAASAVLFVFSLL